MIDAGRRGLGQEPRLQRSLGLVPRRSSRARSTTARPVTRWAVRSITLGDGTVIREKLLAHSDETRSYTYDFQKTPFDVDNYNATIRVTPVTDGGKAFVEWWTTFDCDRDQQSTGRASSRTRSSRTASTRSRSACGERRREEYWVDVRAILTTACCRGRLCS